MSKVWDMIAEGKAATVQLPASARRPPRRTRILRVSKWGHYAGFDPAKGTRPRCHAPNCWKWLTVTQPFACSEACVKRVHDNLALLERAVKRSA